MSESFLGLLLIPALMNVPCKCRRVTFTADSLDVKLLHIESSSLMQMFLNLMLHISLKISVIINLPE